MLPVKLNKNSQQILIIGWIRILGNAVDKI